MTFGASSAGYTVPRLSETRQEIVDDWLVAFGSNAQTSPGVLDGLHIDVVAEAAQLAWEGNQGAYNAGHYTTAIGSQLDALLRLFSFPRQEATFSTGTVDLYGTATTVVPAASIVVTNDTAARFLVDTATVIPAIGATSRVIVEFSGVAGGDSTVEVVVDGDTASTLIADGSSAQDVLDTMRPLVDALADVSSTVDGGVNSAGDSIMLILLLSAVTVTADGGAFATADEFPSVISAVTAESLGATAGAQGSLTERGSTTSGWLGVTNELAVLTGRNDETDPEYRARHDDRIQGIGSASAEAIAARLKDLTGVISAFVFENLTDTTDAAGRPPHSLEASVLGGSDTEIGALLLEHKPAGIQTFGTIPIVTIDSNGNPKTTNHSRPTDVFIHASITVTLGEGAPLATDDEIKDAVKASVVTSGTLLGQSRDVYTFQVGTWVDDAVTGVASVVVLTGETPGEFDATPPLTSADIVIDETEISRWAAVRITVVLA